MVLKVVQEKVESTLRRVFYKLGLFVARYPKCMILICVLICGGAIGGLAFMDEEYRPEVVWVDSSSSIVKQNSWISKTYSTGTRTERIIITARNEGDDVLTKSKLLQFSKLVEFTQSYETKSSDKIVKYSDLCKTSTNGVQTYCITRSVLDMFYDESYITSPPSFIGTVQSKLRSMTDSQIKETLSSETYTAWDGSSISKSEVISGVKGSGDSLTAASVQIMFTMNQNSELDGGMLQDKKLDDWEEDWSKRLDGARIGDTADIEYYFDSGVSATLAGEEMALKDVLKLNIGFGLVLVYGGVFLGNMNFVQSRIFLTLGSFFSIMLAVQAGMGLSFYMGQIYSSVHGVIALLLLGIGMDDTFVIVTTLNLVDKSLPTEERIAEALSRAGSAVTVTSITNACSFFVGAITGVPAIASFSIAAGLGILFVYFMQTTFFVALLTFDTRRQVKQKTDLLCCVQVKHVSDKSCCCIRPGVLSRFFEHVFAPFILHPISKIALLVITLVVCSVCVVGVTKLKIAGTEVELPSGSYQEEFYTVSQEYFANGVEYVAVYSKNIEYNNEQIQRDMVRLLAADGPIATNDCTLGQTMYSWFTAFRAFNNVSSSEVIPTNSFYGDLRTFLNNDAGARFKADLVFESDVLVASRNLIQAKNLEDHEDYYKCMTTLQTAVTDSNVPDSFPFMGAFIETEINENLKGSTIKGTGIALGVVFFVATILIGNLLTSVIAFLGVMFSVFDIVGMLHFWDLDLSIASATILAISVGLTIDFSAHIGLKFMESTGTRNERIIIALKELGPALAHGCFSTMMAVLILAFAELSTFRAFFKMFTMTLGFGLFHGIVLVPIVLSYIGPESYHAHRTSHEKARDFTLSASSLSPPTVMDFDHRRSDSDYEAQR